MTDTDIINSQLPEKMKGGIHGSFDVLKVLLAYVVIFRHFTQSFSQPNTIYSALICSGISTAAVPIFFILSGYLFFSRGFSWNRLGHQLARILKLYLAWTAFYAPVIVRRNINRKHQFCEGYECVSTRFHLFRFIFLSMVFNRAFVCIAVCFSDAQYENAVCDYAVRRIIYRGIAV